MKSVILLIVALGLTAALYNDSEKKYEANKEYQYDYKVQVLSGLPETSKTTAGLLLKCKVKLILHQTKNDLIIKLEDIRLKQLMKELNVKPTTETRLPEEEFIQVPREQYDEMEKELKKPCKARWENGMIKEVKAAVDDKEWSVNMKKAVLNAFSLDLNQNTIRHNNDATYPRQEQNDRQWMDVFDTRENTLFGECEPKYSIHHDQTRTVPVMNVTKIVDPLKCEQRPVVQLSVSKPQLCEECEQDQKDLVKTNVEYSYGLLGNRQDFFIEEVEIKSYHVLQILRHQHGTLTQFVKAKLSFERKTAVEPSSTSLPAMRTCDEKLKMKTPEKEEVHEDKPPKMERKMDTSLLSEIERKIEEIERMDIEMKPKAILELIPVLKEASVSDLQLLVRNILAPAVHTRQLNEQQKALKKLLLVDILPFVRTKECVFVINDIVSKLGRADCIVEPEDVKEMFNSMSLGALATKWTVNQIHETCKKSSISAHKEVKKACWMAYANTLKKLVINEKFDATSSPIMNDDAFLTEHKDNILELLDRARTENEKLLAVKVMATVPLSEFVEKCYTIATDHKEPMIVRVEAAHAMQLYAKIYPKKVMTKCLTILMDKNLPTEVRAAAFKAILICKPTSAALQMIASCLNDEEDLHLVSYCHSYLVAVSKAKQPCFRQWAKVVRQIIRMIRPKAKGLSLSWGTMKTIYSDEIRQGLLLETGAITTSKSFVPKLVHAKAQAYTMGRNVNLFEVAAYTQGIQKLLAKLLGPNGSWENSVSMYDLMRRKVERPQRPTYPEVERHHQEINDRLQSLMISDEEPKIAIYMKFLGNEMPFLDIDSEFLQNMKKDGRFHVSDIEEYIRQGVPLKLKKNLIAERLERIMPCPTGFFVKVKLDSANSVKMDGHAKLAVEPGLFRRGVRDGQIPEEVKMEIKSEPKVATYVKMALGLEIPTVKIATKLQADIKNKVAIDVKAKADPQQEKVEVEFKPAPQEVESHYVEIKPENEIKILPKPVEKLTSLRQIDTYTKKREIVPTHEEFTEKDENLFERIRQPETVDQCDVFGMKIEGNHKYYKSVSQAKSVVMTPRKLAIRVKPCRNCPEKFIFRAKHVKVTSHSAEDDWELKQADSDITGEYRKIKLDIIALTRGQEKTLIKNTFYAHHKEETKKTKMDWHIEAKPLNGNSIEICIAGQSALPNVPEQFTRPLPEHQMNWPMIIEFNFGKCHQGKPAIRAEISVKKSQQQIEIENRYHTQWPEYQSCVNEPEYRRKHLPECQSLMLALATVRRYHIVVDSDTNQIPPDVLRSMRKCPYLGKCPLLKKIFDPSAPAQQHIVIDVKLPMIDVNPEQLPQHTTDLINLEVQHAEEEPYTVSAAMPMSIPIPSLYYYAGLRTSQPYYKKNLDGVFYLRDRELNTFDGRRIPVDWNRDCETILVKDRSDERGFAITARRNPTTNKKELKIIVGSYVCKVEAAAYSSGAPIVTVNNVRYSMSEHQNLRFPTSSERRAELKITKLNDDMILVEAPKVGVQVKTNGIFAETKVSRFHYGQLAGLAGNFDGQIHNDNVGPSYIAHQNWDDLFRSYSLPSDQCRTETRDESQQSLFRDQEDEDESRQQRRVSYVNW